MTLSYKLKELPLTERPRERLMLYGPEKLSSAELIAVILGSGTKGKSVLILAQELLSHFGSLSKILEAGLADLCKIKGLGKTRALQVKAALSLAQKLSRENIAVTEKVNTPEKAYLWVRDFIEHEKKEVFGVILLDARGGAIRWEVVSVGTLTQTLVHPREVFYPAIRYLAASVILVHNHPSGDPTPSSEDRHLTRALVLASQALFIPVLDHLIIGKGEYISLKESGFQFSSHQIK
jgi:DNA repair protein RadC